LETRCAAIASRQFGIISKEQALTAGLSPAAIYRRVRRGAWVRLYPDAYRLAGATETWRGNLLAATFSVGSLAVASHRSAAALWHLDGFREGPIELSTAQQGRRLNGAGVLHHSRAFARGDVRRKGPQPVTEPARTLMDLGSVSSAEQLEGALECALRRGLTSIVHLNRRLAEGPHRGRDGVSVLRALVEERHEASRPAESLFEVKLSAVLRRNRLPLPQRQFVVRDGDRFIARVDFAYPERRVAIETDGYATHFGREAWERDKVRRNALRRLGWRIVEVTWRRLVDHPEGVVADIRGEIGYRTLWSAARKT